MDEKKQIPDKKKGKDVITVKANKKGRHVMKFMNFLRIFIIPIVRIIKPFRIYGNRKVKDGACVYILNHYALLDPMYPVVTTWEGVHFLAKRENFETPVVGWVARKTKTIWWPSPATRSDIPHIQNGLPHGQSVFCCSCGGVGDFRFAEKPQLHQTAPSARALTCSMVRIAPAASSFSRRAGTSTAPGAVF